MSFGCLCSLAVHSRGPTGSLLPAPPGPSPPSAPAPDGAADVASPRPHSPHSGCEQGKTSLRFHCSLFWSLARKKYCGRGRRNQVEAEEGVRRAGVGGQRRVQEQRSGIREHGTLREWDTEVKQNRTCVACNRERKRRVCRGGARLWQK